MPRPMNDLVVVVPGILGSELRQGDRLIWGFPEDVRGLVRAKSRLKESAADLELKQDDPIRPELDDGVRATALVSLPQVVAGFFKVDGYGRLRDRLLESFQLEPVDPATGGNYLEFPYDWRRDNRAAAHRLHGVVNEALDRLNEEGRGVEAKAIYVCHSMGGLVTRYHLEVLGGWRRCRALITLATPYRGAVNAIDFLVRGYKTAGVDLSRVLRSCTSVYQLLPIYKMVDAGGDAFDRVDERDDLPNVSQERARDARAFHLEIAEAVKQRPGDAYPIFYFSGVAQPTLQSVVLQDGAFRATRSVPDDFPTYRETGDGTVPYVSSIPPELSDEPRGGFIVPTCHATIQGSEEVLGQLEMILNRLQDDSIGEVLDATAKRGGGAPPAIALRVEDVYTGDRAVLRACLLNARKPHQLEAELRLLGPGPIPADLRLIVQGEPLEFRPTADPEDPGLIGPLPLAPDPEAPGKDCGILTVEGLPDGIYRVTIRTVSRSGAPVPVEDVFEVARPDPPTGG